MNIMKTSIGIHQWRALALPLIAGLFATACATTTPVELTDARVAYARASAGPAAQLVPADLHKARTALDQAEEHFAAGKDVATTIDLAYIAQRTSQIAEAHAESAIAEQKTANAKQEYGEKQDEIVKSTQGALAKSRAELTQAQQAEAAAAQQAGAERSAREAADQNAAASEQKAAASDANAQAANDALAKLAAKDDERGMVITLSGSVLFRSNDATLLPTAQTRLDQVADALVAKGHDVVVEGYTDSRGSQSRNLELSQQRADSVRVYLVSRGFPSEKILAHGMGPDRPIAENTSAEGRANNRRVEIVISKAGSRMN
jgi:outer membrane protein OmpA-like peptidoglycan-associated protein